MINVREMSLQSVAEDFGARVLEAERTFVAAAWLDPVSGHDAAFDHGIYGDRFADSLLGFIYSYVVACAELGSEPSLMGCIAAGRRQNPLITIKLYELYNLITQSDTREGHIDHYAADLARYMDHRERASEHHIRELGRLLVDPSEFTFTVRRRRPSALPKLRGRSVA